MMDALREWFVGIAVITLLLSVVQTLVPDGAVRRAVSFTGGLILLLAILQPVLKTDLGRLKPDLTGYEAAVEKTRIQLESHRKEELKSRIENRTAAYISDKAASMGRSVTVTVRAEENENGIPIPAYVEIDSPPLPELAQWLERELGLGAERQVWNDGED